MITNMDVFNALKTLEVFCADHYNCEGCPLGDEVKMECAFHEMVTSAHYEGGDSYAPCFWNVESLRPLLDPTSATLNR